MTTRTSLGLASIIALGCLAGIGCGKKDEPSASTTKESDKAKTTDKVTEGAKDEPKEAVEKPAKKSDYKGNVPDETKEMMGLDLQPQPGGWKPVWDADAKVAKWEHEDSMTGIVIRKVSDKLDSMDDLKEAAPMMMQLGTNVTKVVEDYKKTDKGWYGIVEGDGMGATLIYVRDFGVNIVCSANVSKKPAPEKSITKEEAIKACESFTAK